MAYLFHVRYDVDHFPALESKNKYKTMEDITPGRWILDLVDLFSVVYEESLSTRSGVYFICFSGDYIYYPTLTAVS